jgi:hypothetical protein
MGKGKEKIGKRKEKRVKKEGGREKRGNRVGRKGVLRCGS